MTLATATRDGRPSARIVLLKGIDERGFRFFTNYASRKGRELAENPRVALVFYWAALERQVRVTGRASMVSPAESDAYFASRPLGSRFSAAASRQSSVIASRDVLTARLSNDNGPLSRARSAASKGVGRILCASRRDRILAAGPESPARSSALPPSARWLLENGAPVSLV